MSSAATSSGIFLDRGDGRLVPMVVQPYEKEDLLQRLLAEHPELLAGDQVDSLSPRRWLLVARELGLSDEVDGADRWSLDHLFLDQDAIPTLVEVKRSSNREIRRQVVGQMLDYAANAVVYLKIEKLQAKFNETCKDCDPAEKLRGFLGQDKDPGQFWLQVKTNLQAGKVRMIFVADEIPSELRRIVEFLNTQMDPAEVLAVEVKQFVGEGFKTLVPRVIGQTAQTETIKSAASGKDWTKESVLQQLRDERSPDEARIAEQIIDWAEKHMPSIAWGRGSLYGSFFLGVDVDAVHYWIVGIRTTSISVKIEFQFGSLKRKPPFDDLNKRLELLRRFNQVPGINLPEDSHSRFPTIPLSDLKDEASLQQFLEVLGWFTQQFRAR
jgi:hypothetical protein